MKRALIAAIAAALWAAGSASGARHDTYPLHPGSAGPRVCGLSWMLQAKRPSVWRSPRFHTFHGQTTCWWKPKGKSQLTKAVRDAKYWLGYPLPELDPDEIEAGRYFTQILQGKVRRPAEYIARAAARAHPPAPAAYVPGYPLSRKATICGVPGVGTHSFVSYPNNWQSDRALDLCVTAGTPVLAVGKGSICGGCGFGYFSGAGGGRFAGQRFTLNLSTGDQVYYAHLRTVTIPRYASGVPRGKELGLSGVANGVSHLHIACMRCNPYSLAR